MACEYCTSPVKVLPSHGWARYDDFEGFARLSISPNKHVKPEIWFQANDKQLHVHINFCPMCGRDLRGDE